MAKKRNNRTLIVAVIIIILVIVILVGIQQSGFFFAESGIVIGKVVHARDSSIHHVTDRSCLSVQIINENRMARATQQECESDVLSLPVIWSGAFDVRECVFFASEADKVAYPNLETCEGALAGQSVSSEDTRDVIVQNGQIIDEELSQPFEQFECYSDADCNTNEYCDAAGTIGSRCVEHEQPPTPDPTPEPTPDPLECSASTDCPVNWVCENNRCEPGAVGPVQCSSNSHCPSGYVCDSGACIKKQATDATDIGPWIIAGIIIFLVLLTILVYWQVTKKKRR